MTGSGEIDIEGRTYGLVERVEGQHYEATLQKDSDTVYTVHCHHGLWTCKCPAMKFRKRDDPPCKHIRALRRREEEAQHDTADALSQKTPAALPPEQQSGAEARQKYQEQLTMPATAEATSPDAVRDARGLANMRPAPQQVTTAPAQQPHPHTQLSSPAGGPYSLSSQSGRIQFGMALLAAQKSIPPLPLDGYNAFHRYHYTRSETIIEAGRKALIDNGLIFIPPQAFLEGWERDGPDRLEWVVTYVVRHVASGEDMPFPRRWPVCVEKGSTLTKATGTADTECLAYFLRGLLLIPRKNPPDEEPNARDDQPQQVARPAKAQKPAKPPPPANGVELEPRLRAYDAKHAAKGHCKAGDLFQAVLSECWSNGFPNLMREWDGEQCRLAMDLAFHLAKKMSAPIPAKT
jgi:hypothetical protein